MPASSSDLWDDAVSDFQASLSKEERDLISVSKQEDIMKDVTNYENIQRQSSKLRRASARIQPFVDVLDGYGKAMDVFGNSQGLIPPIWGSLRVLILVAQRFTDYYMNLISMLEQISDILPRFSTYSKLFKTHQPLRQALEHMYRQILMFIFRAKVVFTRSTVHTLIRTTWKSFDKEFDDCLSKLRRYRDLVEDEARLASLVEQVQERERAEAERRVAAQSRERLERLESIISGKLKDEQKRWLNARTCVEEKKMIQKQRLSGSCEWILKHDELRQWKHNRETQVFWIHGPPGCGKSFIYSKLLEHIGEKKPATYFLFCGGDKERVTLSSLFRSWCLQLVEMYPNALSYLESIRNINGHSTATDSEIMELLEVLLEALPSCYLTLDALDECSDNARFFDLIAFIPKRFKILVTSRTPANIRKYLAQADAPMQTLQIRPEFSEHDLRNFVDKSITMAHFEFSDLVIHQIRERLGNCDGMFLWVSLMIEELRAQTSDNEALQCLRQLPEGLPKTYERILQRIIDLPRSQRLLTLKLFLWALTVKRPVSITEMRTLLAIQPFSDSFDEMRLPSVSDDTILSLCGGLIQYRGSSKKIFFTHFTVTEYLDQFIHQPQVLEELMACYDAQELVASESLAAVVCLRYLSYEFIGSIEAPTDHQQASELLKSKEGLLPILSYATSNWFHHVRAVQLEAGTIRLATRFLSHEIPNLTIWWHTYWFSSPESRESLTCPQNFSGLHVAAYFGLSEIISHLLRHSCSIPVDSTLRSPLWWAASRGHVNTTKVLLEAGYDPDAPDQDLTAPSHRAAALGHSDVLRLMHFSTPTLTTSLQDREGWTPLHWAAARGHFNILRLALDQFECRYDTRTVRCNSGRTPFHVAAFNGHTNFLERARYCQGDINSKDGRGWTALHLAAIRGHPRTVVKLLNLNADSTILDSSGKTAAQKAELMGNQEVYGILLRATQNMSCIAVADKEEERRKALETVKLHDMKGLLGVQRYDNPNPTHSYDTQDASALESILNGHVTVLKLLLRKGREWKIADDRDRTSLHYAAALGQASCVSQLFFRKIHSGLHNRFRDQQDDRGWTALHYAAAGQFPDICKILLANGISAHLQNNEGFTAFDLAVKGGDRQTVEMIARYTDLPPDELSKSFSWGALHRGARYGTLTKTAIESADPKTLENTDVYQRTPLYRAVEIGHREMAQLLLGRMDLDPSTTLDLATLTENHSNDSAITNMLLENLPANCLLNDIKLQGMAIQVFLNCIRRDNVSAVYSLTKAGVDVNGAYPSMLPSPLHFALNLKSTNSAKALIHLGANVSIMDSKKRTPLYIACEAVLQDVVEDLLNHGADVNFILRSSEIFTDGDRALRQVLSWWNVQKCPEACFAIARLLIKHGASLTSAKQPSNTAAWTAVYGVNYLIQTSQYTTGTYPGSAVRGLLELFSENGCAKLAELPDDNSLFSIHRAAAGNDLGELKKELDAGVPVDWRTAEQSPRSPLQIAVQNSYLEAAKLLVEHGANVHVVSVSWATDWKGQYSQDLLNVRQEMLKWLLGEMESRSKGYFAETHPTPKHIFSNGDTHKIMQRSNLLRTFKNKYSVFADVMQGNIPLSVWWSLLIATIGIFLSYFSFQLFSFIHHITR